MEFIKQSVQSELQLNHLRVRVLLGCSLEERQTPQDVLFKIRIRFNALPEGSLTDCLEQTICYAALSEKVKNLCANREFKLIEKLGWETFRTLKEFLPPSTTLKLETIKVSPPIEGLEGGASFVLSDQSFSDQDLAL